MQGLVSGMRRPRHLPVTVIGVLVLGACVLCDAAGFPVCPLGLQSCGSAGCYSSMFTRCVQGQCQSIIASFVSGAAATRPCPVKYLNTCGNSYCGVNEGCLEGVCHQTPAGNSSQVLNYTLENAAMVTLDMSALEMCSAARKTLDACADDNSQLQVIECNAIGIGRAAGVTCLQSHLFNCAGGPGFRPFFSCRALSVLGDVVTQAVGDKVENVSQPVFDNLAKWVGNVSQSVLNISIPSTQASSDALATLLSGSKANDSASADGFKLAPPDGINSAHWSGLSMGLLVSKHC